MATSDKPRAAVMEHGGKSYVRIVHAGQYHTYDLIRTVAVNGQTGLDKAPGDDSFLIFDGKVETIEKITPPHRITTKYELREDLRGAAKADVVSVDQFRNMSEADQALYLAAHEDIPQTAEPIAFVVQSEDGPPSLLPKGVICTDKNYYARLPGYWHLGPVRATAKYVLWMTAKRLDEIIQHNRYIKWSSGWGRDLDRYLRDAHTDTFFIEVAPMMVNGIEVKAANFHTMFTTDAKDRNLGYARLVQAVDGDNLADLEAKVAKYVEDLTAQARGWTSPDRCPCCQRKFKPLPPQGGPADGK